jgi:hypothetical protein
VIAVGLLPVGMGFTPASASALTPVGSSPLTMDACSVAAGKWNDPRPLDRVAGQLRNEPDEPAGFLAVFPEQGGGTFLPRRDILNDPPWEVRAGATGDPNEDPLDGAATAGGEEGIKTRRKTRDRAELQTWGRIANSLRRGQSLIAALYFAGPPNPNSLPLYTRHPLDPALLGWTDADIDVALRQMTAVGLNTIKLSYWGYQGETDRWAPSWLFSRTRWPGESGEGPYSPAEQVAKARHFFEKAAAHGLLIAPMIEVSPAFPLDERFSEMIDPLLSRCSWLIEKLGDEPNWLQVYDPNGEPRRVIWLIESVQRNASDPVGYSQAFTTVAEQLKTRFGFPVGFILDPISFYPYAKFGGPEPSVLIRNPAILAINPYNATVQGTKPYANLKEIPDEERQAYAESVFRRWSASGIPFIAPIMPGYDAHKVFPTAPVYGFTASWRERQAALAVEYATGGLSMDTWNGWTEGYAIPPSVEEGDVNFQWASEVVSRLNRLGKAESVLPGDVDGDGAVRIADGIRLWQLAVGMEVPTAVQILTGDLHPLMGTGAGGRGDGKLDLWDVTALLRLIVGL